MTSEYSIRLTTNVAAAVKTNIKLSQGDKGMTFAFTVDEGNFDTSDTTAKIVFSRANGSSVEAELTTASSGYTYTIAGNELAVPGMVRADLKFYSGTNQRISTASFLFDVLPDTMDGFNNSTGSYSSSIESAIATAKSYAERAEQAVTDVSDAEAYASGKRNGQELEPTDPAYQNNSKYYAELTAGYVTLASSAKTSAETAATNASASATSAGTSEANASASATAAASSATSAGTSETNAASSATAAASSATSAGNSAADADRDALKAEGYAEGTQNGIAVTSESPYYHNNAKYYSEQAQAVATSSLGGLTDVTVGSPQNGQALVYNSQSEKWENKTVTVTVDSAMSDTSTNPVENKVVKSAIDAAVSDSTDKAITNITIATSAWEEDSTYADFSYKADVPFSGIDSTYFADVVLAPAEAMSGNYAPVCVTGTNKVSIYAIDAPIQSITVLAVKASKVVTA